MPSTMPVRRRNGGLTIAEYFGLNPTVIDTTNVGGSSYQFHAAHGQIFSLGRPGRY